MRSGRSTLGWLAGLLVLSAVVAAGCGPSVRADAPVVTYYYIPG